MINRLGTYENKEKLLNYLNQKKCNDRRAIDVVLNDTYSIGIHTKINRYFFSVFYAGQDEEDYSIHHPTRAYFYGTCVRFKKEWYLLGFYTPSLLLHILNILSITSILNEDMFFGVVCFLAFCLMVLTQIARGEYRRIEDYLNNFIELIENSSEG